MMVKIGSVVGGRYRLVELLGQGSMAAVYKAHQESLERYVAIKFLRASLAADPSFQQRFRLEAQNAAALHHSNIIRVHDFGAEDEEPYMVMEFIDGQTLAARLTATDGRPKALPLEEVRRIAVELGSALAYAHARAMIHRDIKPANVMLTSHGRVVLTDFGLAKLVAAPHMTAAGYVSGTPNYMAPEQILAAPLDNRADIYALGVLLYELVTGHLPFVADNEMSVLFKHLTEPPPPPQLYTPDLPRGLEYVLFKALAKEPADRYQSIEGLLTDLARPDDVALAELDDDYSTLVLPWASAAPFARRPTNLPAPATSFIGREQELLALQARLGHSDVRLLTLTGPGGAGKTRLALQVAAGALDKFEHGVFFVNLAPIREPALLANAIARALGLVESGAQTAECQLESHVRGRQLLLVLDNLEHLLEGTAALGELLAAAPGLKILATSREPLRLYGEQLYPVPPLPLPDPRQLATPEELSQYAAVRLFVARAQAADMAFSLTPANAAAVAELCVRLDGLPLALELAAAQVYSCTVAEMVEQLAGRLGLLADGPRDRSARQQTMRGAIEWSYELLDTSEQTLFARLGVFVGRFTEDAAQAVVGEGSLASLVRQNLLQQEQGSDGSRLFWLLELLREYALERQAAQEHAGHLRRTHAAYYLSLAETAEPNLTRGEQAAWFARLEEAHDNFRAALGWAVEEGSPETALGLSGVLWRLWAVHSHLSEGRQWLDRALANGRDAPAALRARVHFGAGRLALFQSSMDDAQAHLTAALAAYRQLDNPGGQADALNNLGEIALERENYQQAETCFREALVLARAANDRPGIAHTLNNLGQLAFWQGEYQQAGDYLRQCLAVARDGGTPEGLAVALNSLGEVSRAQGNFEQAAAYYQESLGLYRQLNYPIGVALLFHNLGYVELQQGRYGEAAVSFKKGLNLLRTMEEEAQIARCLAGLAVAILHLGEAPQAVRLFGAADAIFQSIGGQLDPVDREIVEQHLAASRLRLDEQKWQEAWSAGHSMPLEKALTAALLA